MKHSDSVPERQKQDSDSDSQDDLKDPKDDSDSSDSSNSATNHNSDLAKHRLNTSSSITERLNQLNLQKNATKQLSVKNEPRPQDTPTQENGKSVLHGKNEG